MLYIVNELLIHNESNTFPKFISNWTVKHVNGSVPLLTTTSEDKANSYAYRLNQMANSRDEQYEKGAFAPFFIVYTKNYITQTVDSKY